MIYMIYEKGVQLVLHSGAVRTHARAHSLTLALSCALSRSRSFIDAGAPATL